MLKFILILIDTRAICNVITDKPFLLHLLLRVGRAMRRSLVRVHAFFYKNNFITRLKFGQKLFLKEQCKDNPGWDLKS